MQYFSASADTIEKPFQNEVALSSFHIDMGEGIPCRFRKVTQLTAKNRQKLKSRYFIIFAQIDSQRFVSFTLIQGF